MIRNPRAILILLTVLNLLNYLDRYVVSAVVAPMQGDLHLSNFVAGLLPTVFLIGYFVTSPVFGVLGDRSGAPGTRRLLLASGVGVWSAATVGSGLASGVGALVSARAAVGVGEASFATLSPAMIDAAAPSHRKARWMAVYCAATPVGSALGYLVGGAVAHAHGWRAAFYVAGIPGLLIALPCAFIADPIRSGTAPSGSIAFAARRLLGVPLYLRAVLGYCVYTFAIGGFAFWAPKYLHVRYGLEPGYAGVSFGAITVVGGAVGTFLGGWAADRSVRGTPHASPSSVSEKGDGARRAEDDARTDTLMARANLRICAVGCALGAPLAALAIAAPSASLFLALALPCQIAVFLLSGPINVALLRSAPPELRASAMAVAIFAIHMMGDLWSPPLIGLAADHAPMQEALVAIPAFLAIAAAVWWRGVGASGWLTEGAGVR